MRMNRRNALIGLGALAVGGGAAFGTGAFSQVAADRTVNIEAAGDAAALLGIEPALENTRYVRTTEGTFQIDLDGSELGAAEGINFDAMTFIEPLFRIRNNGAETVGIRLDTAANTDSNISISSTSTEDENGGSITTTVYDYNSGNVLFNFYTPSTNTTLTTSDDFETNFDATAEAGNNLVTSSGVNLALDPDVYTEVALAIDTLGTTSAQVTANTELLNEIRLEATAGATP